MAKNVKHPWDLVAVISFAASWVLIGMGMLSGLSPDPWAWIAMILGLWPVLYVAKRILS